MEEYVVFGARGMAGVAAHHYFKSRGHNVTAVSRAEFDIARDPADKIGTLVRGADAIVNCAGVIKPMIAKQSVEDVLKVNAIFPRNLAKVARQEKIPCFHLTTDCVWTGRTGAYDEDSTFDAEDLYGISKNAGDTPECMTLRTSIIGEERGQARSLIAWAQSQKGKEVNGFVNHRWNGVTTLMFAKAVESILTEGLYQPGIFHLHSPDTVTKAEMLRIFSRVYDLGLKVNETNGAEFCDRSMTSKFPLASKLVKLTVEEQVRELRDFFKTIP